MKQLWHILTILILTAPSMAAGQALPPCDLNLLRNPGCDEALIGGEIPNWTEVAGSGWTCRSSDPPPLTSPGYFFSGEGDTTELVQDVDVSAYSLGFPFRLSGAIRTRDENPSDLGRVVFEFRGQGGTIRVNSPPRLNGLGFSNAARVRPSARRSCAFA